MKVIHHPDCLLHNPPHEILSGKLTPYLESPTRIKRILHVLQSDPSFKLSEEVDSSIDVEQAILRVHKPEYLRYLETAYDEWVKDGGDKTAVLPETFPHPAVIQHLQRQSPSDGKKWTAIANAGLYCFDLSCPITPDTYKSSLASVRVALTAASQLTKLDRSQGIFALCRPPGHHAASSVCGGYCYLNNVAVTARYLQQLQPTSPSPRIAILDVDYHHGNGTQEIFYTDPSVLYVSIHAENDFPYFTGGVTERGVGEGLDLNMNLPLPKGVKDDQYLVTLDQAVGRILDHNPEYLIVSLGVDTYVDDPICAFEITTEAYKDIGRTISLIRRPTLFVMEGGYNLEAIGANVKNVLTGFEDKYTFG